MAFPLIAPALLRNRTFLGTSFVALTFAAAGFGPIVFLTLYLLDARGASPTLAGLELAPYAVASLLVSLRASRVTARLGVRATLVSGLLGCAAGLVLLLGLGADSSYLRMLPGLTLFGVGAGLVNPTMTVAALTVVDVEHAGMASGVNNACRQLGIAAGIAGLGAVLEARRASVSADGALTVDAFLAGLDAALLVAVAVAVLGTAVIALLLGRVARVG